MDNFNEPDIIINGKKLTTAQAMTVRVAIGSFGLSLIGDGLGTDETGMAIKNGYLARITEINKMMRLT